MLIIMDINCSEVNSSFLKHFKLDRFMDMGIRHLEHGAFRTAEYAILNVDKDDRILNVDWMERIRELKGFLSVHIF